MILRQLLSGGSFMDILQGIMFSLVAVIVTVTVHEFAHALTSHLLGDDTAKNSGMMTLNPMKHANPRGIIILLLIGFGWFSPIIMNVRNFKNRNVGVCLTAASGSLMNFLTGLIAQFAATVFVVLGVMNDDSFVLMNLGTFFNIIAIYNISYGVFNLIPFPPLDGSKILVCFLPPKWQIKYLSAEKYWFIFFIAMIFVLDSLIISPIISTLYSTFMNISINLIGLFF